MVDGEGDALDLPWGVKTRQQDGRDHERELLRRHGIRAHPASGAGPIKYDGSDDEYIYEIKLASKTHTVDGRLLRDIAVRAAREGKEGMYVVTFDGYGVCLYGAIHLC